MTTPTKVHCFFEQSGTFKNEFRKLGIPAEDYDIQNNFGETDHVIDLFAEIEKGYDGKPSVFDSIGRGDLIMAFFPCIYFNQASQTAFTYTYNNYTTAGMDVRAKTDAILERAKNREYFYSLILRLFCVAIERGLRMIVENPATKPHYLLFAANFVMQPTLIDGNRQNRGDCFRKPTAYWFLGCKPTAGTTYQRQTRTKTIKKTRGAPRAGLCSEERSMISPDYARNFIADFILGKPLGGRPQQQDLFAEVQS